MSLRKRELRPDSQLKNNRHKKRKIQSLEKQWKKQNRVMEQRDSWLKLQNEGKIADPKFK